MKFIHAHQIAKNTMGYASTDAAAWPLTKPWWRLATHCAIATTKARSTNNSNGVEVRCASLGSLPIIG